MRKKNGFTLVELLAVIVILAIIMIVAIPSVLDALSSSRKDSFYLYAQKLYSEATGKYTRDLDENKENINCVVYDIAKDLGLSDTGNFEGWAKVSRKAVSSGKNTVEITISTTKELQSIKQCVGTGTTCTPDESYFVPDETKKTTISRAVKDGQVLCVSYQVPNSSGILETQPKVCKKYSEGVPYVDTYAYEVLLTITNKSYSVENVVMNDEMSKEDFFAKIDEFNDNHSNLEIKKPGCTADDTDTKGTTTNNGTSKVSGEASTTLGTEKVTTSSTTAQQTQTVTVSSVTTRNTELVTKESTSANQTTMITTGTGVTQGTEYVTTGTGITQGTEYVTSGTGVTQGTSYVNPNSTLISNERSTTYVDKTTGGPVDEALMLQTLAVDGYDISFNPGIYYYNITVPYTVTSLNVTATPKVSTSQYTITGQTNLGVGENVVLTEVFNPANGKRAYYRIFVIRMNSKGEVPTTQPHTGGGDGEWDPSSGLPDPTLEESDASLRQLRINGYTLDFNPEVYEYTLETRGESEIFITASPKVASAKVLIKGNTEIKDGSEVVITVTSKNNFYTKTYKILIKEIKEENSTTKTFKALAIGLGALLGVMGIVLLLTKKNRRSSYSGTLDSTSGPGVPNQQFNNQGQPDPNAQMPMDPNNPMAMNGQMNPGMQQMPPMNGMQPAQMDPNMNPGQAMMPQNQGLSANPFTAVQPNQGMAANGFTTAPQNQGMAPNGFAAVPPNQTQDQGQNPNQLPPQ